MQVIVLFTKLLSLLCTLVIAVPTISSSQPNISAASAVAMDSATGYVFYEKSMDAPLPIASTTKIMTCLLACESGKLDKMVKVNKSMLDGVEGTMIYLKVGDCISLYDLVQGAMLASGNDAAKSIAVFLAGSEDKFCHIMNRRAVELGMKNTEFRSASGLDIGNHHSTAYDMALLATEAVKNKTLVSISSQQSAYISVNGCKQKIFNHNKLLSYDSSYIGLKTGFTNKAGRCLVSAYKYKNNVIIVVTLNDPQDWQDHKTLVEFVKDKYNTSKEQKEFAIDVVGSNTDSIIAKCKYDIASIDNIEIKYCYYPIIYAPVKVGDRVGKALIYSDNKYIMTVVITAEEEAQYYA
ncbi:MAG: D-alanyl-D-alanine carboxypeptidase family protein [Eubacterium sp.]